MSAAASNLPLAYERLASALAKLEAAADAGRFNTLCIRDFSETALLLGAEDYCARGVALLRRAPDDVFGAGVMTNVTLPADFADRMRRLSPLAEIERRHPPYDRDAFLARLRAGNDPNSYVGLTLAGRIEDAVRVARPGLEREEVAITLAVLGRFDEAFAVAEGLEPFRRSNVRFVAAIELLMAGRVDEARRLRAEVTKEDPDPWSEVQLALALAGREPWGGYPYPDW